MRHRDDVWRKYNARFVCSDMIWAAYNNNNGMISTEFNSKPRAKMSTNIRGNDIVMSSNNGSYIDSVFGSFFCICSSKCLHMHRHLKWNHNNNNWSESSSTDILRMPAYIKRDWLRIFVVNIDVVRIDNRPSVCYGRRRDEYINCCWCESERQKRGKMSNASLMRK